MSQRWKHVSSARNTLIWGAVLLALLVGMVLDTTFLPPEGAADVAAPTFSPAAFVEEEFPSLQAAMVENAVDIAELAPAIEADPEAAGEQYGVSLGAGRYVFQIRATGTVDNVDEEFIELAVPEVPEADVRIPLGSALTGTPVRDATGAIQFGDFPDQTAYQSVANEFKLIMEAEVLLDIDPASLDGQQVTVVGAWVSGPPAFIIQPVWIEVTE